MSRSRINSDDVRAQPHDPIGLTFKDRYPIAHFDEGLVVFLDS